MFIDKEWLEQLKYSEACIYVNESRSEHIKTDVIRIDEMRMR